MAAPCPLLGATDGTISDQDDAAIGEALLLADLRVFPTRAVQLRENIRPGGMGFV